MSEQTIAAVWRRRLGWSIAADRLKATIGRARLSALAMSAAGAVLATAAATVLTEVPQWRTASAMAGAMLVAAATFVATRFVTTSALRAWTRARSVSEAIKGEIFMFRAGAEPYSGPGAVGVLQQQVRVIEEAALDLERYVAGVDVNREDRPVPPSLSPKAYIEKRVMQQIEGYYRPNARLYARWLSIFRFAELVFGLVATLLGAVAAYISGTTPAGDTAVAAWVAVFTTLGAAMAAHVAATRYDFLVVSYYATARHLEDLVGRWRADGEPTASSQWTAFVKACEDAISIENESWLAKWAEKDPGQ